MINVPTFSTFEHLGSPLSSPSLENLLATATVLTAVQPIFDLASLECVGHELLARARPDSIGIELQSLSQRADSIGLGVELSRWLRQDGLRKTASRVEPGRLFVNTHPKELDRPGHLLKSLTKSTQRHPGVELVVEIHPQAELAAATFSSLRRNLKALGVGVAFDDFGEGRSRLLELATAPADYVKFAPEMVRGLDELESCRKKIVRPMLKFIHSMGAVSIATGVETPGEMEACRDLGFQRIQGSVVGRPWIAA